MKCFNCDTNEGTIRWSGDRSPQDAVRQMGSLPMWCKKCALEAQIAHIKLQAMRIPELEKELKEYEE